MVDPKDIAVLTPYNAQAAAISKGLRQRGVIGVTVTSITKSQGEATLRRPFHLCGSQQRGWWANVNSSTAPSSPPRKRVALCAGEHGQNMPQE